MTSFNMRGDFLRALSPWQIPRSCPVRFSLSNDRPGNAQQAHGHQTGERGFSHAKLLLSLITSINSSTFFILLIKINSARFGYTMNVFCLNGITNLGYLTFLRRLNSTASCTRAVKAFESTVSSAKKSIARHALPSRPALNSLSASTRLAPW